MVRRRKQQQDWVPATEFKVTRLRPNGPKPGQSTRAWLYGKEKEQQEFDAKKAHLQQRGEL